MAKKIILASASPQRLELFKTLCVQFDVEPSNFDERTIEIAEPVRLAKALALAKAKTVGERFPQAVVVGADTVVVSERCGVLGKPEDAAHAKEMLKCLSGDTHRVITGLAVYDTDTHRFVLDSEETIVHFKPLSDPEIEAYVKSGEPFGKAGGYAIQGLARFFVDWIEGDHLNVAGLPVGRLKEHLTKFL